MRQLLFKNKCRPIRLGFLVRYNNCEDFRRACQINTIIWGGIFNPIIHIFNRLPKGWHDDDFFGLRAGDLLKGYIHNFQPDFLVNLAENELPEIDFPKDRVLKGSDVYHNPRSWDQRRISYSLDMLQVYSHAYQDTYRFVQRHPRKLCVPKLRGRMRLFGVCEWGEFPPDTNYLDDFTEIFQADQKAFDGLTTLLPNTSTPIHLTAAKLKSSEAPPGPSVFVFDPFSLTDLIDYWNLRARGGRCIPLPVSSIEALSSEIRDFMEAFLRRPSPQSQKMEYPFIIRSRNVSEDKLCEIINLLKLDPSKQIIVSYYPQLWAAQPVVWPRPVPTGFHFKSSFGNIEAQDNQVTIAAMHPDFGEDIEGVEPRWMNDVSLDEHYQESLPASVIPSNVGDVDRLLGAFGSKLWANKDGISCPCAYKDWHHRWNIPDAIEIGRQWAKNAGIELRLSNAGHVLKSMVDVSGGLFQARWFASSELIKCLSQMASKSMTVEEFRGNIKRSLASQQMPNQLAEPTSRFFEQRGILLLGLEVQCPHCRQYPWYSLEELAHKLKCKHCMRDFTFPVAFPPKSWCYRSVGPFASPGFAKGAYSVFLSMRFFNEQIPQSRTTCIPSPLLTINGHTIEADFICFCRSEHWTGSGEYIVFGECKCFDEFVHKDITRMKELSRQFPGAVISFCTMREALTPREIALLAPFAEAGRRPRKKGGWWPTPILILTSNELCLMTPSGFGSSQGAKQKQKLPSRIRPTENFILELCDASQQEYLGLCPRGEWLCNYFKTKHKG